MALTGKQQAFVAAYLGSAALCATRAARLAGYAHPDVQGARLLKHPGVKAAIEAELAHRDEVHRRDQQERMAHQGERYRRLTLVMHANAERAREAGFAGGESGFYIPVAKLVKVYDAGKETGYQDGDACPKCDHGDGTPILRDGEVTNLITGERRTALLCPLCTERWHKCLDEERLTPIKQTVLVTEWVLDTDLLREFRELEELMARERGQRKQQVEHSAPGGGPLVIREVVVHLPTADGEGGEGDEFSPGAESAVDESGGDPGDEPEADESEAIFPLED